jgi:hypothetical protein
MVSVEVAKAERKPVPVDVDAIGTVTPISSVALKSRVGSSCQCTSRTAPVNQGDLLFTLDAPDRRTDRAGRRHARQEQAQLEERSAMSGVTAT